MTNETNVAAKVERLSPVGAERLLKLAEHLDKGKLGHKKFDFQLVNVDKNYNDVNEPKCGYAGCAMGELPVLFPKNFRFNREGYPRLIKNGNSLISDTAKFFRISQDETEFLFDPSVHGCPLPKNATRKQVARHIRQFVASKVGGQ